MIWVQRDLDQILLKSIKAFSHKKFYSKDFWKNWIKKVQMFSRQMLPGQISRGQLFTVKDGFRNLPLKFG